MTKKTAYKSKQIRQKRKSKSTSWKSHFKEIRQRKKNIKKFKHYAVLSFIVVTSLIFLFGFFAYKNVTMPFVSASSNSSYDIREKDIIPVVIIYVDALEAEIPTTDAISVLFIDVDSKSVNSYNISSDTLIQIPGKYGIESVENLYGLGTLIADNEVSNGAFFTLESLESTFGYPLEKYLVVERGLHEPFQLFLSTAEASHLLSSNVLFALDSKTQTNIGLSELTYIFGQVKSYPQDRLYSFDLNSDFFQEPGSTDTRNKSLDVLDKQLQELTIESNVAKENISVSVLNGTNVPGLATDAARVVNNIGSHVITVGNASSPTDESVIITNNSDSQTVKALVSFFDIAEERVISKDDNPYSENEVFRSDVTLILGVDASAKF